MASQPNPIPATSSGHAAHASSARHAARSAPTWALLGALVAAITAANVWWRERETRPPHWDMAHHLANSLVYLNDASLRHPLHFLQEWQFYPPLVYWVTDVFYAVLGSRSMSVAVLSNAVWVAVLVFSTYAIGRWLWSPLVGWLSVLFVVTAPMLVATSKEYMLDLPSTAVAALSLYLLIRADGFSRRRYSLLFGVACGCGLLVKWTFPLVIALPAVHALATALAGVRVRRELDRLWNVAGAAALAVAIAGAWWVHNFVNVAGAASYYADDEGVLRGNPRVLTPESALWYAWNLLNTQLYVVPAGVLLVGVVFCVRRRELARGNLYPILMALGTYILFSAMRHKDPRYTLPMLPALAIIATSWVEYVSRRIRAWFTAAFAAYGAVAFIAVSFGISLLPDDVSLALPSTPVTQPRATLFAQHGYMIGHPTREDWHQDDLFEIIARDPQAERTFGYWGPDTIWFNRWGLEYLRLKYDAQRAGIGEERFFIFRGPPSPTPAGFTTLRRWRLPDSGTLSLFRRVS